MDLIAPQNVRRIALLGAGTIGSGWAVHYLARGMTLTVYDPAPDADRRVRAFIAKAWPTMCRLGLAPGADPDALRIVSDPVEAVRDAEFVQESGPERTDLKHELYRRIDAALSPGVVVASSTSGLPMTALQADLSGAARYVIGHPVNPPHLIPLVEVVGGRDTAPEVVEWALAFYRVQGKRAIHIRKEVPGMLVNRLQVALWREAVHAVADGIASVEDVDAAVVHALGLRWALIGPHLTIHLAGGPGGMRHHLEHLGPSIEDWWNKLGAPRLEPKVNEKLIEGIEAETAGRTFDELVAERDTLLVEVLETLKRARGASSPDRGTGAVRRVP